MRGIAMTHKARILVIEDNGTMRIVLAAALADAGYEVIEAVDGMTGLMLAESTAPDLAVLDLHLPDLSGLEIASLFHQRLPFLVLTMDSESEQVQKCIELGALGYLVKPPDIDGFLRQVQIALKRGWENLNLRRALQETQAISKALGILMAHDHLPDEAAYRKLLSFATSHKRRVAEVAIDLIGAFHQWPTADGSSAAAKKLPKEIVKILEWLDSSKR